jgi:outer membrane protein assembly factor BamB
LFTLSSDAYGKDIPRGLFCIDPKNGKEFWRFSEEFQSIKFQTFSSPTIYYNDHSGHGKVLFGSGTYYESKPNDGKLFCVNLTTGKQIWNFSTGADTFGYGIPTSPAVAYNRIFFGACNGKFYALNLNGSLLWEYQTNDTVDGIYSSPAVVDEKVYFGSSDSILYCLNIYNGSLIWHYNTEDDGYGGNYGVASSPAVAYNRVFVGSCNSYLYCFGSEGSFPPEISITNPKNRDMVKGNIDVTGTAQDDIAVILIQVKIDDSYWINLTGNSNWTFPWDTNTVSDGVHTIYVRAFDETGFSLKKIELIVNNGGTGIYIQITSHKDGQIVSGVTRFTGIAGHSLEIDFEIQVRISGTSVWQPAVGSKNWYFDLDTEAMMDGEYLIEFRGYDGYNYSEPITLKIKIINYVEEIVPGNYPMFRTDQNRSGTTDYEIPGMGKELWKFETENAIESSPIFYNNKIYFGSNDYFVYCLEATTGELVWKYETGSNVRSTPAIANKRLYIGSNDYHLYCLNVLSGELIWKYKSKGIIDSSPLIVGNHVVFGSLDGGVYSLNRENGTMEWMFDTGSEVWGSTAYWDRSVYIGTFDGRMHCIWLTNGTERWNFSTNKFSTFNGIYTTPLIVENRVIFGCEDNILYCLNATNGKRIWLFKTTGYIYSSAAFGKDKIFITSLEKENDGILYAIPLDNPNNDSLISHSEVLWKFRTHDFDGGSSPIVSIISNRVVVGSNAGDAGGDGTVYCLDEATGSELWNFTVTGDFHSTPQVALNRVYIGSLNNYLYCLGEKDEEQNLSKININISLSNSSVYSGETLENITVSSFTENGVPVPFTIFNFSVSIGTLSVNSSVSSKFGRYDLKYFAPRPEFIFENTTVNLTVEASRDPYITGHDSIQFEVLVKPFTPTDSTNNTDNGTKNNNNQNNTADDQTQEGDTYLITTIKLVSIVILITIIFIILIFEIKYKEKKKNKNK